MHLSKTLEEFREKWSFAENGGGFVKYSLPYPDRKLVEQFIALKISEAVREMVNAVPEQTCDMGEDCGRDDCRDSDCSTNENYRFRDGYNAARSALLAKANSMGVEADNEK